MTKRERDNWIVNIENTAAVIESQLGAAVVEAVFRRYGAHGTGISALVTCLIFSANCTPLKRISISFREVMIL